MYCHPGEGDGNIRQQKFRFIWHLPMLSTIRFQPVDRQSCSPSFENFSRGTYILVLCLPQDSALAIGKFGLFPLPAGCYAYAGSALGTGGLSSRLRHHLKPVRCPHWHVDYLRTQPPSGRSGEWRAPFGGSMTGLPCYSNCPAPPYPFLALALRTAPAQATYSTM